MSASQTPVERAVNDVIAAIAGASTTAARTVAETADKTTDRVVNHPVPTVARAIVNGFFGDRLHNGHSPLTHPMSLRRRGRELRPEREALQAAYPIATGRLAVFVHGLILTETGWRMGGHRDKAGRFVTYGRVLEQEMGYTSLWVRYNTGLRISTSGRELADLLEDVVANWPVPVEQIVLVGHSMGGLVLHSALAQTTEDTRWVQLVTDTITLGTPHHGAPLERVANNTANALGAFRYAAPIAAVVKIRSEGIKDLRHGNLLEEDWLGYHPDDPKNRRTDPPLHPGVRHLAVAGVLGSDADGLIGGVLGDGMVGRGSAHGRRPGYAGGRVYADEDVVVLPSVNHLRLLNHPKVLEAILARLGEPHSQP
jgi:pimeloyl-ACP methyl ester carboxylesterase